jgi:hypothetical protein
MTGIMNVAGEISRKIMGNLYSRNILFIGLKKRSAGFPERNIRQNNYLRFNFNISLIGNLLSQ